MKVGVFLLGVPLVYIGYSFRRKNLRTWLPGYLEHSWKNRKRENGVPTHVYFCFADHFEPYWGGADKDTARKRVARWTSRLPKVAKIHRDFDGRPPVHTFFYPVEEYDPEILDRLAEICRYGYGDVEVHLHHDGDTGENLRRTLLDFTLLLHERHGLLRKDSGNKMIRYGFIHGNWALDNSRRDGRYCGVNDELTILKETGCYADFTLPSAPSDTQTRKVNSIYFAKDNPAVPKSHDCGEDVRVGHWNEEDLLLVQGPLGLNWSHRKFSVFPRIENGEVSCDNPATRQRIDLWIKSGIGVRDANDSVFVKVYTHGAQDANSRVLLGGQLEEIWGCLEQHYNDGNRYRLHYVSAYEMYRAIRNIAAGD